MLLFQINDDKYVCLFLLSIIFVFIRPCPLKEWSIIDFCLGGIVFYELITCWYSECTIPAIRSAIIHLFCWMVYWLSKRIFSNNRSLKIFNYGSCFLIGVALLLAVCSFFIFRNAVLKNGFEDTYHFRFLFRPLGYITNVWAEILLIILGWLYMVRRYVPCLIFLTLLAVLFSFSRGAYLSLGVFLLISTLCIKTTRKKLHLLFMLSAAIFSVGVFCSSEMKTTIQMNATASQRQSTEGRINASSTAYEVFLEYPLLGHGSKSYTFAIDRLQNQDSRKTYTSFAPNIVVLLLTEKGCIGFLLYLFLCLAIFRYVWKYRDKENVCIAGATFLALLIKELAQATLHNTLFVMFMACVLLAFMQKDNGRNLGRMTPQGNILLPLSIMIMCMGWGIWQHRQSVNETLCKQSFTAFREGKLEYALELMEKTDENIPYLIQRGLLYTWCFQQTGNRNYFWKAESVLKEAARKNPKDIHIYYMTAFLYAQTSNSEQAISLLQQLVQQYPDNSLFRLSLWEVQYQTETKVDALSHLVYAVSNMPRILTLKRIENLKQVDSVYYQALCERLHLLLKENHKSASDLARLGYIANWLGEFSLSEQLLKKSVSVLPNLSTPWRLLGEENKYRLLMLGAFRKDYFSTSVSEEPDLTDELLLYMMYKAKFKDWYESEFGGSLNFL